MLKPATFDQFSEKGQARYYQLKSILAKKYEPDEVVLIETDSGDYFVDKTTTQAYKKAQQKYPDKKFFIAQVGRLTSLLKSLCKLS